MASQYQELWQEIANFYKVRVGTPEFTKILIDKPIPDFILAKAQSIYWSQYFAAGQEFDLKKLILHQKFTQPPTRFSAASLIKKLEELGIGRPSTYASIISTLQDRTYIKADQSAMEPTALGMSVNEILSQNFSEVTGSDMTAQMEDSLDMISRGEAEYEEVLSKFWTGFKAEVEEKFEGIKNDRAKYLSTASDVPCPTCGSVMELKVGRFGEFFQCQAVREHQFPKNFKEHQAAVDKYVDKYTPQIAGRKCEVCDKDLIVRVSKSSLKPYIACPDYKVGNKHTVTNLELDEIDAAAMPKKAGGKRFFKKKGK